MNQSNPLPKKQKVYVCTRPNLVRMLSDLGYSYTLKKNIFHPDMCAWEFPLTGNLAWTVDRYFQEEVGKPAPRIIQDALKKARSANG